MGEGGGLGGGAAGAGGRGPGGKRCSLAGSHRRLRTQAQEAIVAKEQEMATIQEAAQNAAAQSSSEILAFNAQINLLKDQLSTSSEDVTTKVTKIAESTARVEALEAELKLTTDQVGLGREGREEDERRRGTAS